MTTCRDVTRSVRAGQYRTSDSIVCEFEFRGSSVFSHTLHLYGVRLIRLRNHGQVFAALSLFDAAVSSRHAKPSLSLQACPQGLPVRPQIICSAQGRARSWTQ